MKLNKRNSKGITLIALIVTIIGILILASVSINILFGENGIIEKQREQEGNIIILKSRNNRIWKK